jgi:hypothetical protein
MNHRAQDRFFAATGITSVVLHLGGIIVGSNSGRATVSLTSSPSAIAASLARPVGTGVWVAAHLILLSYCAFLVFAVWAAHRLGSGLRADLVRLSAACYVALGIAADCVLDATESRAGLGIDAQLATALARVNEALFVGAWFLYALFLVAAGAMAVTAGRRALGWAAIGVATLTVVGTAVSADNLGQNAFVLWLAWTVWASISLARDGSPRTVAVAAAV